MIAVTGSLALAALPHPPVGKCLFLVVQRVLFVLVAGGGFECCVCQKQKEQRCKVKKRSTPVWLSLFWLRTEMQGWRRLDGGWSRVGRELLDLHQHRGWPAHAGVPKSAALTRRRLIGGGCTGSARESNARKGPSESRSAGPIYFRCHLCRNDQL